MTRRAPKMLWIACTLSALLLLGCVSLRAVSAGRIGCHPEDITISDEHHSEGHHWIAACQGRRYQCSEYAGVACAREQTFDAFAEDTEATRAAAAGGGIERAVVREGESDVVVLRANFDIEGYRYGLTLAPVAHLFVASLSITAPSDEIGDGCAAGLLVDGQLTHLHGAGRVADGARTYEFPLDVGFVRRLATASRVVGRICDVEWRLDDAQRGVVRELLTRHDEEAAWTGAQTSGGASPTQASGTAGVSAAAAR